MYFSGVEVLVAKGRILTHDVLGNMFDLLHPSERDGKCTTGALTRALIGLNDAV